MDFDKASNFWTEKDALSKHLEESTLKKKINNFLSTHKICALATANGEFVRCTPLEYNYIDEKIYIFSEGGLKFKALKDNKNVSLAIFEESTGFGQLASIQIQGSSSIIKEYSDEYNKLLSVKKISLEAAKKLPNLLNLICIEIKEIDYLDSNLKKEGYSIRQHLSLK